MSTETHNHHDDGHAVPPSFANPLGEPAHMDSVEAKDGAQRQELEKTLDEIEVAVDQIRTEILDGDEGALELMKPAKHELPEVNESEEPAKVGLFNVDKWNEEYKVRMDALRHSVDELNARLDAFKRQKG